MITWFKYGTLFMTESFLITSWEYSCFMGVGRGSIFVKQQKFYLPIIDWIREKSSKVESY